MEVFQNNLEIWVCPLITVAELRVRVEFAKELKYLERTDAHPGSEIGVWTAYDKDQILNYFRRVHVLLEHHLLVLDQVKVLSHEEAHREGVEFEAFTNILL